MKNKVVFRDLEALTKEELIKERDTCLKEIDEYIKAGIELYRKYENAKKREKNKIMDEIIENNWVITDTCQLRDTYDKILRKKKAGEKKNEQ